VIQTVINSPVGELTLAASKGKIIRVAFGRDKHPPDNGAFDCADLAVLDLCTKEFSKYFEGKLKKFTVPLELYGTEFRKRVWAELQAIPYGTTITYKELAIRVGNPKACRAVGGANHHNPTVIIVPCHRVIGSDGKLTGFGGGLDVKSQLLAHERGNILCPLNT